MTKYLGDSTTRSADSKWQGDKIPENKPQGMTRLVFHNLNGINLEGIEGIDQLVAEQISLQVDIQAMSEHCLDTTKHRVYQQAKDKVRRHSPNSSLLSLHSSTDTAIHTYKPGGTGILLLGPTVSRINTRGVEGDKMGRWSAVHFTRRSHPPLTVISAYQIGRAHV